MWPSECHLGEDRPQVRAGGKAFVLDTKVTWREGGIACTPGFLPWTLVEKGRDGKLCSCLSALVSFLVHWLFLFIAAWRSVFLGLHGDPWLCTWLWTLGSWLTWDLSEQRGVRFCLG